MRYTIAMLRRKGTTLVETLIGVAIIGLVVTFALGMFSLSAEKLARSKFRVLATALANEQVEIIRNAPFSDVGTQAPTCEVTGTFLRTATVVRSNVTFTVDTCVRWVDDPFDKLVSEVPPDTVPTDYKLVEISVTWPNSSEAVKLTTSVMPKGLESPSNTGSLLVKVIDSSSQPVAEADVYVTDTNLNPDVNISSKTDVNGNLQLLGLTPDVDSYNVRVTKAGYTTHQTFPVSAGNPNPVRPDLSISAGGVLDLTFTIDHVSSLAFTTVDETCQVLPGIGFSLRGNELKGNPPPTPVLLYDQDFTTNASGQVTASDLRWDYYTMLLAGTSRNIAGIIPPSSLNVLPNTNALVTIVLSGSYSANSLLANIKDANTNSAISGATVELVGVGTKTTGQGTWAQTDWSGGSGQVEFSDATMYSSETGGINVTSNPGHVTLSLSSSADVVAESFSTDDAKDPSTTAVWDTGAGEIRLPQSAGVYEASAVAQTLQLSTPAGKIVDVNLSVTGNANGQTVRYYVSADGTSFEEVTPEVLHTFVSSGDALRFRIEMETTDSSVTPIINEISLDLTIQTYASSGTLTSSTFDTGTTTNFFGLTWSPEAQVASAGADALRVQMATNDDNTTWNFVGPDGTAATYFTVSGDAMPAGIQAKRYVRYKVYLQTEDQKVTPGLSDISVGFTTGCTPPGQTFFPNLSATSYTVNVSKTGYTPLMVDVNVSGSSMETLSLVPL
jgi:type II secretory pathway pseudopilin PulG